jgi:ribonucleoside-diphosphate reductase beta chain
MSILSWDDFEDDSQKPAAPEHKSAPVEPQKAANPQMVSAAEQPQKNVATAQPASTLEADQQIQPIRWQEHLTP